MRIRDTAFALFLVFLALILLARSAEAQEYIITPGLGGSYIVTPHTPRPGSVPYVALERSNTSTGYVAPPAATNNPLVSVTTPHWQIWSGNSYWGYYHTRADCDQTKELLRQPLIMYTLICRYVR